MYTHLHNSLFSLWHDIQLRINNALISWLWIPFTILSQRDCTKRRHAGAWFLHQYVWEFFSQSQDSLVISRRTGVELSYHALVGVQSCIWRLWDLQKDVCQRILTALKVFCQISQAPSLFLFVSPGCALYSSLSLASFDLHLCWKLQIKVISWSLSDFYDSGMILWVWSMAPFLYKWSSALLGFWVNSTRRIFSESSRFLIKFWKKSSTTCMCVFTLYFLSTKGSV